MPTECSEAVYNPGGAFDPNGAWEFPRSYVYGVSVRIQGFTSHMEGNVVVAHRSDITHPTAYFIIRPEVFEWSSNVYSLSHVICGSWFVADDHPTGYPLSFLLGTWYPAGSSRRHLWIGWNFFPLVDPQDLEIPGQPADYWLPA